MTDSISPNPSNLLGWSYEELATSFAPRRKPIIDVHSHIHGSLATPIYMRAADLYGVGVTYTMTLIEHVPEILEIMGESVRLIAVPNFVDRDRVFAQGQGYIERLKQYQAFGARIAKFWNAPRIYEGTNDPFVKSPLRLSSPLRQEVMKVAMDMGMMFMAHVADPDTWFSTKYTDQNKYGTKAQQYDDLEEMLVKYPITWIAAHMGGYPEDLGFLSGLLSRHDNLYLDCSATRWIVRELSKHSPGDLRSFFTRWKGRIMFGSDIVTTDAHVSRDSLAPRIGGAQAYDADEAYDLYASRYWALRTLLETSYDGPSPISDPDLHLVDPERYDSMAAPLLRGASLPDDVLDALYFETAENVLKQ